MGPRRPIRCELLDDEQRAALLARLGPHPLRGDDPAPALAAINGSPRRIGELLLDQVLIAGVGNVLRAEALHLCGVHPDRPGANLADDELRCLCVRTSDDTETADEGIEVPTAFRRTMLSVARKIVDRLRPHVWS